jgi:hypothetical protein
MIGAGPRSASTSVVRASVVALRFVHAAAVEYVELSQPGTAEFLDGRVWIAWTTSWIEALKRCRLATTTRLRRIVAALVPAKASAGPNPPGCCC